MDKKITRRAVLGTAVAALAVSPFVIRSLRKQQGLEDFLYDTHYGHIDVTNKGFLSDVTQGEVKEAFDILFRERDAWLKFRKFSGDVVLTQGNSDQTVEASLLFELLPSSKMLGEGFPWVYRFTCKDKITKNQLWVYTLDRSGGRGNVEHLEGKEIKTEIIGNQAGVFTFPLELMYAFSNERVEEAFRTRYKVSVNPEAKNPTGSYSFRTLESETDLGRFFTENGVLTTLRTSRLSLDSGKGIQWQGFDWKSFGKLRFPSRIELSELTYEGDSGDSFERKLLATYAFENFTIS